MDTFKNDLQVFSSKLYLIAIVVGFSLGTCTLFNLFVGANTEAAIWKKTSIQTIVEANQAVVVNQKQAKAQQKLSKVLNQLKAELAALNDLKVDKVIEKYFKGK